MVVDCVPLQVSGCEGIRENVFEQLHRNLSLDQPESD